MLELRTLRYFTLIAELRSVSQAARRLHVAQPSLTRQIHKLEADLGTPLFLRLTRGVALTQAGEILLDHARRLLRDAERAHAAVREHGADPGGQVLLGLPPTLGPVLLPRLITRMRAQYPRVVLDVVPSRNITITEWLLDGKVDIAVIAQATPEPDLLMSEVAQEEMVLLTGPGARRAGIVTARDLAAQPVIGTESLLVIAADLLRRRGIQLAVEMVVNNLDAVREMVRQSLCCTVFPYGIVRADHRAGLVDAHRITRLGLHRRLAIATSARRPRTTAMRVVVDLCREGITEVEQQDGFKIL